MKIWIDKSAWTSRGVVQKAAQIGIESIKKIAVIKHAALGDMLLTRPFLITLREYFPKSRITLSIISKYTSGVPNDLVDHIHLVERSKSSPWSEIKNYRGLGDQDLLFDISATSRSFWITILNRARLKIGFIHKNAHRFLYDIAVPRSDYKFEAETFLDQLLALGLSYKWPLLFNLNAEAYERKQPYILYFPTASDEYKCWPKRNFIKLIKNLSAYFPSYDHIILAGLAKWEQKISQEISNEIGMADNFDIISGGDKSLNLVAGASLVVSNDTGIRNMAIAVNVPTVGIFFSTLPFRYLPRFGQHEIAFSLGGAPPTVSDVEATIKKILIKES